MKYFTLFFSSFFFFSFSAQWSTFTPSTATLSSPRSADLNADGIMDIVIGAGVDTTFTTNGILAFDGATGNSLWTAPSWDEIFTSAIFNDITNDNIPDVFIGGRKSQFFALNGADGSLIWEAFPQGIGLNPADSGWYNFYSGQLVPDQNGDFVQDILVANGGDHDAAPWQSRPPGHLMVLSGIDGSVLARAVVPDSNETYCSPVIADIQGNGTLQIVYGTGGENHPGSMWLADFNMLMNNDLSSSVELVSHPSKGFIAPASLADFNGNGYFDIIVQSYSGEIMRFDGITFQQQWSVVVANSESSAAPVIGNFYGGDMIPDVFAVCNKGVAPSFFDHYQIMIDGVTGNVQWIDSISDLHFASANAFDANNDGRDEVLITVNNISNYFQHELLLIDFQNDSISSITSSVGGVNLASTPLVKDMDNNGFIDIVYVFRADSLNPSAANGIITNKISTSFGVPNSGIAWGAYMGNQYNGIYSNSLVECGTGSIVNNVNPVNPTCNNFSDGMAYVNLVAPFDHHTFLWSDGSVDDTLFNAPSDNYKLIVSNSNGCMETVFFSLTDPYVISFGNIIHNTCEGDSIGQAILSSSGCPCMFSTCSFNWENGDSTKTASNLSAGFWTVEITHLDGCIVIDSVEIFDGPPIIDSVFSSNTSCYNSSDGEISLFPSDTVFTTYSWSNGSSLNSINGLSPGNYSVAVDNLLCYDSLFFNVESPDSVLLSNISTQNLLCHEDSSGAIGVLATSDFPISFYNLNNINYSTGQFNNLSAGNYQVFAQDSEGCYSDTLSIILSQPAAIDLLFTTFPESGINTFDGVASVSVSGGVAPYSYLWSNLQTDSIIIYLQAGSYFVSVTDANGCSSTDSVLVQSLVNVSQNESIHYSVFPNPVTKSPLTITSSNQLPYKLELFDLNGALIREIDNCQGSAQLNLTNCATGLYNLVIKSEGSIRSVPILVN